MTTAVAEATETKTETSVDGAKTAETAVATTTTTAAAEAATQTTTKTTEGTAQTVSGPPEQYALTVPDDGLVTAEGLKAFESDARADGLTQAQAQARLDRQTDAFYARVEADRAEVAADPTYGGAHLPETQRRAEAAMARFAPAGTPHGDAIRTLLRESGRGDALAVVALWASIGKAMDEDRPPVGGAAAAPTDPPKRLADQMYRETTSKGV